MCTDTDRRRRCACAIRFDGLTEEPRRVMFKNDTSLPSWNTTVLTPPVLTESSTAASLRTSISESRLSESCCSMSMCSSSRSTCKNKTSHDYATRGEASTRRERQKLFLKRAIGCHRRLTNEGHQRYRPKEPLLLRAKVSACLVTTLIPCWQLLENAQLSLCHQPVIFMQH